MSMASSAFLMFGKGQHVVIIVRDGEFCCAVESLFEAFKDLYPFFNAVEEGVDIFDADVEEERASIRTADPGKTVAQTPEGLEHERDFSIGNHGPVGFSFDFAGNRHGECKTEELIEVECGADVVHEEVGG